MDATAERSFGAVLFYLRVSNVLDASYRSFGILSENLRGPSEGVEPFVTPGHPRQLMVGMRIRLQG